MKSALGRVADCPAKHAKSKYSLQGGYDKGILGKESKAPKTKLRKARK